MKKVLDPEMEAYLKDLYHQFDEQVKRERKDKGWA